MKVEGLGDGSYFLSLSCTKIDNIEVAEEFVGRLYGSSVSDINSTRAKKVRKITKITGFHRVTVTDANKEKDRGQLDRIDCLLLPPCWKVLTKKSAFQLYEPAVGKCR